MLGSIVNRLTGLSHLGRKRAQVLGEAADALAGIGEVPPDIARALADRNSQNLAPRVALRLQGHSTSQARHGGPSRKSRSLRLARDILAFRRKLLDGSCRFSPSGTSGPLAPGTAASVAPLTASGRARAPGGGCRSTRSVRLPHRPAASLRVPSCARLGHLGPSFLQSLLSPPAGSSYPHLRE
jgi:hypothetical protein